MSDDTTFDQPTFDALLAWLDPDRDQAGTIYEQIRRRLIKIFECRGCHDAEELADKTINTVMLKVPTIAKDYVGEKTLYFYGVARNIFRESLRKRTRVVVPPPVEKEENTEDKYACLDDCMLQLTADNRNLVLAYYENDKRAKIENRKALAEKLGVAQNALRIRAHRIRRALQKCFQGCLAQKVPA